MALGIMLLLGFWAFYPYNPVEFKSNVYPVMNENHTVKHGEILKYEIDYCKYTDQLPVLSKKYIDGIVFETPLGRGIIIKGCHKQIIDNVVPDTLVPGEYYMQIVIDYEVNPIRHIIYVNNTEKFIIE